MNRNVLISIILALLLIGGAGYFSSSRKNESPPLGVNVALAARFDMLSKNGKKYPLSGAQPYASVKQLIELALQEK